MSRITRLIIIMISPRVEEIVGRGAQTWMIFMSFWGSYFSTMATIFYQGSEDSNSLCLN